MVTCIWCYVDGLTGVGPGHRVNCIDDDAGGEVFIFSLITGAESLTQWLQRSTSLVICVSGILFVGECA